MRLPALHLRPALLAAVALAGCSLGPDYERPALDLPPAFRATGETAAAAWPEPEWWQGFGSAELNALVSAARARNQDLAAAAARVVQADAQARITGSALVPSLSGTADFSYTRSGTGGRRGGSVTTIPLPFGTTGTTSTTTGPTTGTTTDATTGTGTALGTTATTVVTGGNRSRYFDTRSYGLGLQVGYELDFWGRNRALAEGAGLTTLATRFDQETVALTVVTSVADAYFQAVAAQDRVRIAQRNLRDAEQILAAFRARLEAGTSNALDVSQQEALVAQQRANIPSLRNLFEQQAVALGILTGQPPSRLTVEGSSFDRLKLPAVAPGLPSELLARRPDIAAAEAALAAQNANVRAARAAFFPAVQLTASGGLQSAALSAITGPGTLIAQLGAALTQAIFDGGLRRGQLDFDKARFDELQANYRQAVLQAFTDTEQALAALRLLGEQERLVSRTVAVAGRSAEIARAQLQAGTIDIVTALNVQNTLFGQLDLMIQVRLARFQALVNLYRALGGGWTQPGSQSAARNALGSAS